MILDELPHQRVLILGLAREGMSIYAFLRQRFPLMRLTLADQRGNESFEAAVRRQLAGDDRVDLILGADSFANIPQYDVIFKSPGVSPYLPEFVVAARRGQRISSNTELFFEVCPGTVIGVTGTKGKSTTTTLIYETLRAGGVDARLAGNIGVAPLQALDGTTSSTVFVMEMSSHQLHELGYSPSIAVLQGIVPEHLDYYGSFAAYAQAKATITRHQTENHYLIFNTMSSTTREIAMSSNAQLIPFGFERAGDTCCYIDQDRIVVCVNGRCESVVPVADVPLRGVFNLQNVMPAVVIGTLFGLSNQTIADAVQKFRALEHRLEPCGSSRRVQYYNDSLSTVPEATIAAIQSFGDRQVILLAGGFDRGQDYGELASTILARRVKGLILFPTTGERLWEAIERMDAHDVRQPLHIFTDDMEVAVRTARDWADEGDVVILSPAAASFGSFDDYRDRGNRFKVEVAKLIDEVGGRDRQ